MATLTAFPMLERGRKHEGLRVCRAAWLLGVTVREYRASGGRADARRRRLRADVQRVGRPGGRE